MREVFDIYPSRFAKAGYRVAVCHECANKAGAQASQLPRASYRCPDCGAPVKPIRIADGPVKMGDTPVQPKSVGERLRAEEIQRQLNHEWSGQGDGICFPSPEGD